MPKRGATARPDSLRSPGDAAPGIEGGDAMEIAVWYGDTQVFGAHGDPQSCINVLGSVSDAESLRLLEYRLDGGPYVRLGVGPDRRRLAGPGDFNVEIDLEALVPGDHLLELHAVDHHGTEVGKDVSLRYMAGRHCALPYSIDWARAASVQEFAQVVDGRWELVDGGIRSVEPGYDRLVAVGDVSWRDFEVTVPVTVHSFDDAGRRYPSSGPGVGVMLRWTSHRAWRGERSWRGSWPARTAARWLGWEDWGDQPRWGWWPFGALGWYRWAPRRGFRLNIMGNRGACIAEDMSGRALGIDTCYAFKLRVQSRPGSTSLYRMKVWEEGTAEPAAWDLTGEGVADELAEGSILLVSHHADATFGDVHVDSAEVSPED